MTIVQGLSEEYPFKVECPNEHCFFTITTQLYSEAERWNKPKEHGCPRRGETKFGASVTESLLMKAWAILDSHTGIVMSMTRDHPDRPKWMGQARGVAEVIALFMPPHFRTADEVVREAMKRYQAAQEGREHKTPGLGDLKYTFPDDPKYKNPLAQAAHQKEKAERGTEKVDDKTKEDIAFMKSFMKPGKIAEATGLSVKTIERVLAELS